MIFMEIPYLSRMSNICPRSIQSKAFSKSMKALSLDTLLSYNSECINEVYAATFFSKYIIWQDRRNLQISMKAREVLIIEKRLDMCFMTYNYKLFTAIYNRFMFNYYRMYKLRSIITAREI